jgi:hypothetical protein
LDGATDDEIVERGSALDRGESVACIDARLKAQDKRREQAQVEAEQRRLTAEYIKKAEAQREEQKKIADKQRLQEELTRQERFLHTAEQERITANQWHLFHIAIWRNNPAGIRNEESLRDVCLECGSREVKNGRYGRFPNSGNRECQVCRAIWYVNHCWNCDRPRERSMIDSRDSTNPPCEVCNWRKCAKCNACRIDGCKTNPYSSRNRLRDHLLIVEAERNAPSEHEEAYFFRGEGVDGSDDTCDFCNEKPVTLIKQRFVCKS